MFDYLDLNDDAACLTEDDAAELLGLPQGQELLEQDA